MSGGMYGADIEALRLLADKFVEGSGTLDTVVATVEGTIPQEDGWSGPDAEGFRQEWTGTHLVRLRDTAIALSDIALKVRANADAQETTSNDYAGGGPAGGPGGPFSGAGGPGMDTLGAGGWGALGLKALTTGLAGWKGWKTGSALWSLARAQGILAPSIATVEVYRGAGGLLGSTARWFGQADDYGLWGKLGTTAGQFGRVLGGVGGVFGVVGGFNQMFNSEYDGARGAVDRIMGGVSVVGGAGSIALALGAAAALGPVGVGVVVGAGVVAGAWALGNMIYDNREAIGNAIGDAAGFVADGFRYQAEVLGAGLDVAKDVAGAAVDKAGDAVDAVGDGLKSAGNFVGGLFS